MKKAFTLIELLMVIAIIAIISTLAVNKVGGLKETSARRVSIANQKAVERGVEGFLSIEGNRLNRLDALLGARVGGIERGAGDGFGATIVTNLASGGFYRGPTDLGTPPPEAVAERNRGLSPNLTDVLCLYSLSRAEVKGLVLRLGLRHLAFHDLYANLADEEAQTAYRLYGIGDDGGIPTVRNGLDPEQSACVIRNLTNEMYVAAINPKTNRGRAIYRACGQDLLARYETDAEYSDSEAKEDVALTGGPIVAFGLGDEATIVGNVRAGLDAAPFGTFMSKHYYRRYVLLFRLRTVSGAASVVPEFVGVLDGEGNTVRVAQQIVKGL